MLRPLSLALCALALFGIAPAARAAPCTAAAEAQNVLALQARLAAAPAPSEPGDITPGAQQLVPALREALAAAITRTLQCDAATLTDPAAIKAGLVRLVQANRPAPSKGKVGDALAIAVRPLAGGKDVIAVTANFTIDCGDDNILLLFRRQPDGWQRILNWHSDKYTAPSDAFGDFFGYTVTPGADGSQLIAVAHGTPWCTSSWSRFAVDLLAPATAQTPQKLLAHSAASYNRNATLPSITPRADGFTLRLTVASRDADTVFSYTGVFRYRTLADRLDRQPVANNARDFVDSWLSESWPVAARWAAPPLEPLHNVWARLIGDKAPLIGFGPVRACAQASRFQVQLDLNQPATPPHLYAKVLQGDGLFTLLAMTPDADPSCTGPNLMTPDPATKRGK